MIRFFAKFKFLFVVLLVISAIVISIMYQILKPTPRLPIYQPIMVNPEMVDETKRRVKKYHTIGDFELLNQNGDTITHKDYEGHIYIADFFFTTCPTICIPMKDNMVKLQERLIDHTDILLLSHTVTPEIDSVPVMRAFADKKGVIDSKWNLLTGDKKHIYELARKSYLVAKDEPYGGDYDMIHTENFVLVDRQRIIRGFYDGTDWDDVERLIKDIDILLNED